VEEEDTLLVVNSVQNVFYYTVHFVCTIFILYLLRGVLNTAKCGEAIVQSGLERSVTALYRNFHFKVE